MGIVTDAKVTHQGILIPRNLVTMWGDIKEVEIEQRPDVILIKPKITPEAHEQAEILHIMKAEGLIEDLPWKELTPPSPETRALLAERLSQGPPLSELILADRDEYA